MRLNVILKELCYLTLSICSLILLANTASSIISSFIGPHQYINHVLCIMFGGTKLYHLIHDGIKSELACIVGLL